MISRFVLVFDISIDYCPSEVFTTEEINVPIVLTINVLLIIKMSPPRDRELQ